MIRIFSLSRHRVSFTLVLASLGRRTHTCHKNHFYHLYRRSTFRHRCRSRLFTSCDVFHSSEAHPCWKVLLQYPDFANLFSRLFSNAVIFRIFLSFNESYICSFTRFNAPFHPLQDIIIKIKKCINICSFYHLKNSIIVILHTQGVKVKNIPDCM